MRPLPFILVASDHGPLIVNRHDYHQLPNGSTYGVGFQILTYGSYDPGEISAVLELLNRRRSECGDGLVVVDCGANIGVHALEMANHMTGWGSVVAIEAQERLFYALCGNIALANLFNAKALNEAVGSEVALMPVPKPNYNKPASFGSLELRRTPSTEYIGQSISYAEKNMDMVRVTTLDNLALAQNWSRVDFIKIDVEGMEMDVLRGAQEVISQFRPFMLIEWIKTKRTVLEDFLTSINYSFLERGNNLEALPNT